MREYDTSCEAHLRRRAAQLVEKRWIQIAAGSILLEERKKMTAAKVKRAVRTGT
jgi:hypothetical protein